MLYPLTGVQTGRYSLTQSRPLLLARSGPLLLARLHSEKHRPEDQGRQGESKRKRIKAGPAIVLFRDECMSREMFLNLREARVVISDWRLHYNEERPHSRLDYYS